MEKDFSQALTLRALTLLLWVTSVIFTGNATSADSKFLNKFLSDIQINQGINLTPNATIPGANQYPTEENPVKRPTKEQETTPPRESTKPGHKIDIKDVFKILAPVIIDNLKHVTVPDLRGKTIKQAERELKSKRLRIGQSGEIQSKGNPGTVVSHKPKRGESVKKGTIVDVVIAKPFEVKKRSELHVNIAPKELKRQQGIIARFSTTAKVRIYTGKTYETRDLTKSNQLSWFWRCENQTSTGIIFTINTKTLKPGKHPVTLVVKSKFKLSNSFLSNTKISGDKTAVLIIKPALVKVPSVIGEKKNTATNILRKFGFTVNNPRIIETVSGNNTVVRQSPNAGNLVKPGSAVKLVIAIHKPPDYKIDIQSSHLEIEENRTITLTAKLAPHSNNPVRYTFLINGALYPTDNNELKHSFSKAGRHEIYAKAIVDNDKTITSRPITIKVKPALVSVPSILEEEADAAKTILKESKLLLGGITEIITSSGDHKITEQSPRAGERVNPGTSVSITIAIPPDYKASIKSDKHDIEVGDQVSLIANLDPLPDTAIHYTFFINDEAHSVENNTFQHIFLKDGTYNVYTSIKINNDKTVASQPLTIQVSEVWKKPVSIIKPESIKIKSNESVIFSSHSQADERGDLALSWSAWNGKTGNSQHFAINTSNIQSGQYWVTLTVTDSRNNTDTSQAELIIEPLKNKWVWWLPIALGGFGMAAIGYAVHKNNTTASTSVKKLKSPRLSYLPETDLGTQSVSENANSSAAGLCVQVETDIGEQAISTYSDKQEKNDD